MLCVCFFLFWGWGGGEGRGQENESSDVNKTFIDIGDGQKFELLGKKRAYNFKEKSLRDNCHADVLVTDIF